MNPDWYEHGVEHIWLPYTQMKTVRPPLPVKSAQGCRITLEDGTELIDGIASWWSACHGYNHPYILEKVTKQLQTLPHIMFGGLVNEPALTLAKRLAAITPEGLNRVFFTDSGSVAVEVAMKIALQYWQNKKRPNKDRFLCFHNGYHGDTQGVMSISDPERSMHKAFKNAVIKQYVVEIPSDEYGFAELDDLLGDVSGNIAGMVIEPLVQGAGGMIFHSADTLAELHRLAKKHDILFIADEIATGFGRTGTMFACDEAGFSPDIMCVGKALTAGVMTLAATVVQEEIFQGFYNDDPQKALMHGPTFMANALASTAANASLDLFESEPRLNQIEAIENQLREELAPCESLNGVVDVRVKGAIGVVQMEEGIDVETLKPALLDEGVWVRPFGNILYVTPAYTITADELSQLTGGIINVLKKR